MRIKLAASKFVGREFLKIIAFDPGVSVGVANATLMHVTGDLWDLQFTTYIRQWPAEVAEIEHADLMAADIVIVEDWKLRKNKSRSLINQELPGPKALGHIQGHWFAMGSRNHEQFVIQQPAVICGPFREFVKKNVRDNWPGTEHERDALLHLMYYLTEQKKEN
jgi:hypothetical protein